MDPKVYPMACFESVYIPNQTSYLAKLFDPIFTPINLYLERGVKMQLFVEESSAGLVHSVCFFLVFINAILLGLTLRFTYCTTI